MSKKTNRRVCIIGAGAAGVSAAHYLNQLGGHTAVVLEKNGHIGGKCHTFDYKGRAYEMGAVVSTAAYVNTLELARAVDLKPARYPERFVYNPEREAIVDLNTGLYEGYGKLQILRAVWRYARLLKRYPELDRPGYSGVPSELHQPFADWLRANQLECLYNLFLVPVTTYGYGYLEKIPAMHVMKYINRKNLKAYVLRNMGFNTAYRFELGFQELWRRVAKNLDVRLNQNITSIERGTTIKVTSNGKTMEFDDLILACPPTAALSLLGAGVEADEKDLLSRAKYYKYYTIAFRSSTLADRLVYSVPVSEKGRPWLVFKNWADRDAGVAYFYGEYEAFGEEALSASLEKDLPLWGAKLDEVLYVRGWDYFPHFSNEDVAAGIHDKFEAMQGQNNTYFAGGLGAFELVEPIVAYSRDIVEKNFARS